jgi:hypothetical protein
VVPEIPEVPGYLFLVLLAFPGVLGVLVVPEVPEVPGYLFLVLLAFPGVLGVLGVPEVPEVPEGLSPLEVPEVQGCREELHH